jgi:hypothetical protein
VSQPKTLAMACRDPSLCIFQNKIYDFLYVIMPLTSGMKMKDRKIEFVISRPMAFNDYHIQKTISLEETWHVASKRSR